MEGLLSVEEAQSSIGEFLLMKNIKRLFVVCGKSWKGIVLNSYLLEIGKLKQIELIYFSDFHPNPDYESVVKGVKLFNDMKCDGILAAGGGSAIDVAKCIKAFSSMDHTNALSEENNYLKQDIISNDIPVLAVPTTAGTGSEATSFAVIYYKGCKKSVAHTDMLPSKAILCAEVLNGLPEYQRKTTMMDALCHAVESYWCIHSTSESKRISADAIRLFKNNYRGHLNNDNVGNAKMLCAANLAGQAINITKTTAAHAMSYKLTSLFNISHGHAVALCLPGLWRFMVENLQNVADLRGKEYVEGVFKELAVLLTGLADASIEDGIAEFERIVDELHLDTLEEITKKQIQILVESVNIQRLKNNPVLLNKEEIEQIYKEIFTNRGKTNEG